MSVMVRVPVRVPLCVGVKVTLMLQAPPAATLGPQVLAWEKSPLIVMLLRVRVALPVFVRVRVCGLLLVPTACEANVREVAERLAAGPPPAPVRLTV